MIYVFLLKPSLRYTGVGLLVKNGYLMCIGCLNVSKFVLSSSIHSLYLTFTLIICIYIYTVLFVYLYLASKYAKYTRMKSHIMRKST